MKKTEYEVKTRTVTERIPVSESRVCDVCGSEIKGHYWRTKSHDYEFGRFNDDRFEYMDACSPKCLMSICERYYKRSDNASNTCTLDVMHRNTPEVKGRPGDVYDPFDDMP